MARVFGACRVLMAAKAASSPNAASSAKEGTGKLKTSGILKPLPVTQAMKEFVGASEISRPDVVKKIWEHIKANNLQGRKLKNVCSESMDKPSKQEGNSVRQEAKDYFSGQRQNWDAGDGQTDYPSFPQTKLILVALVKSVVFLPVSLGH
ncbi:hypothetical protein ZIOFF_028289 [Zingiber officinale]|uniref:SWIB domain-containing protein n=1 Tax=Zingiber officinale TaxID=94328 RepID=A0A8J5L3G2_ZINOF|nr:hypothetical protein ZIOFF_028289 [Zingiber officinale]